MNKVIAELKNQIASLEAEMKLNVANQSWYAMWTELKTLKVNLTYKLAADAQYENNWM